MEISLTTQEEMIELADYLLPPSEIKQMTDFDKYYFSWELLKKWNSLPKEKKFIKALQLEVYGFQLKTPVWK